MWNVISFSRNNLPIIWHSWSNHYIMSYPRTKKHQNCSNNLIGIKEKWKSIGNIGMIFNLYVIYSHVLQNQQGVLFAWKSWNIVMIWSKVLSVIRKTYEQTSFGSLREELHVQATKKESIFFMFHWYQILIKTTYISAWVVLLRPSSLMVDQ